MCVILTLTQEFAGNTEEVGLHGNKIKFVQNKIARLYVCHQVVSIQQVWIWAVCVCNVSLLSAC